MRVAVENGYVLIGSKGGSTNNPGWVYNLRAHPEVEIRDKTEVFKMRVREVIDEQERNHLWAAGVKAYPPYNDYKEKTSRKIPLFIANLV